LISVCIATYNGEKYLLEQLNSILNQIPSNSEILISDDGSTDNTIDLINSINDKRITLFHSNYKNVAKNFEFLISIANGQYIFLSDQDDIWAANKYITFNKFFEMGYDVLLSDCFVIDNNLTILHESYFKFNGSKKGLLKNIYKNSYMGCCMAFKSNITNIILPFPKSIPMHDWWIGLNSELFYKTYFINNNLLFYRKHTNNISTSASGISNNNIITKISFRFILIFYLTKNLFTKK
jgi:glycosyltransferase involved in cell wall biosynthesis